MGVGCVMPQDVVTLDKLYTEIKDLRKEVFSEIGELRKDVMSTVDKRIISIEKRFDTVERDLRDYAAKQVPIEEVHREIKRVDDDISDINTRVWGLLAAIVLTFVAAIAKYFV